jgi:hypothetical protein
VFTGPYVYITDQNHSYADPDIPIGRQWPVNAAVSIGAGSWLGAGAVILPGAQIGANVVVAAGSVVRGQVPDRCVVAGAPARVVREYLPGAGWARPPAAGLSALPTEASQVCHDELWTADGALQADEVGRPPEAGNRWAELSDG